MALTPSSWIFVLCQNTEFRIQNSEPRTPNPQLQTSPQSLQRSPLLAPGGPLLADPGGRPLRRRRKMAFTSATAAARDRSPPSLQRSSLLPPGGPLLADPWRAPAPSAPGNGVHIGHRGYEGPLFKEYRSHRPKPQRRTVNSDKLRP